jgi:hypothetical protein
MSEIRITDNDTGQVHIFATGKLMFSEADLLEKEWGVKLSELKVEDLGADLRTLAAFMWLIKVRALAEERGIGFRKASEELPPAEFDFNLGALEAEVVDGENPTGSPTGGQPSRTRRAGSARSTTRTGTGAAAR